MRKTIYFVAGEASADNHGAALIRALRERDADLRFIGCGGPQMKAIAGGDFRDWIDEAAVVGLWEVIKKYEYFRKQFHEVLGEVAAQQPDAVVLIDYPGFNLRVARALRRQGAKRKIIYYISPQVWAWNRGRIPKMARDLDLMLCIFPFEAELYNQSGLRTKFVGHPMLERLRARRMDVQRDPNLVGLFPGSRRREVRKIFPILLETVNELRKTKPNLRFEVAAASEDLAREMRDHPPIEIKIGDPAGLMQRAGAGIVASGSATLEAAFFRMPFVLIYKVSWLTYFAGRLVIKVKHLGMPNVIANREIVPEFIQHDAKPLALADAVGRLIDDKAARDQMISDFDAVTATLGEGGASESAAREILEELG